MFLFPGYTNYREENGATIVSSQLHQSEVRITESSYQTEFHNLIKKGGCEKPATELEMLLHNQGLLESEEEIRGNVNELRKQMNNVLYLAIMPTEACNFRCPYCYEDHAPATMEPKILWQIKQFVAACIPRFESVRLGWFGGEPTLCKDTVLDFSQYMQSLGLNHPFELEMSMTTNGCRFIQTILPSWNQNISDYPRRLES